MTTLLACDDDSLKARITAGDSAALDELFRCSRAALTRYLTSRCGDATDAEDALQATFENAVRFLDGYRGDASPRGWLLRVAQNSCTRMRRGKKNNATLHVSLDDRPLEETRVKTPEEHALARADDIFAAIGALEPTDRAVLLLRDGDGKSADETAAQLGLSVAAVKARLFRARRAVRTAVRAVG